jgi:hypothetical protein
MAYDIRDSASLEFLREYVQGVAAGLEAYDEVAAQAAAWLTFFDKLTAARDSRDSARFLRVRTIRRYNVLKAKFLGEVTELSGHAYLLSGKDATKPPYATIFKGRKAEDLKPLGFNNLKDQATALFAAAESANVAVLGPALTDLRASFDRVIAAGEAKKAARLALIAHETTRASLVVACEELGDTTEAAILGALPGRNDLVRLILSPSLDTSPADKKENEDPAPQP